MEVGLLGCILPGREALCFSPPPPPHPTGRPHSRFQPHFYFLPLPWCLPGWDDPPLFFFSCYGNVPFLWLGETNWPSLFFSTGRATLPFFFPIHLSRKLTLYLASKFALLPYPNTGRGPFSSCARCWVICFAGHASLQRPVYPAFFSMFTASSHPFRRARCSAAALSAASSNLSLVF